MTTTDTEPIDWRPSITRFKEHLEQTDRLIRLTVDGARQLESIPRILDTLRPAQPGYELPDPSGGAYTEAKKFATFAREEIALDFPLLHAHSLMGTWGALEAMIDDLSTDWLAIDPSALEQPVFTRIKVVIGDYTKLRPSEQRRHLVSELKRECKSDLKMGLGQFEYLLNAIGLGGSVDKRVRNVLFEAQQIRHLIAHRGGRADARFLESCPGLGYAEGQQVRLSASQYAKISLCMAIYTMTLINRCRVFEELEPTGMILNDEFEGALGAGVEIISRPKVERAPPLRIGNVVG